MSGSGKVTLERPNPAQVSHITHHSLELHWEESLATASTAIDSQSADDRILITVQQLSPGVVEEWHEIYSLAQIWWWTIFHLSASTSFE